MKSALNIIYNYNVLRFAGGRLGAVNGMRRDGTVDRNYIQADEMWTGVTYALAAFLIQQVDLSSYCRIWMLLADLCFTVKFLRIEIIGLSGNSLLENFKWKFFNFVF